MKNEHFLNNEPMETFLGLKNLLDINSVLFYKINLILFFFIYNTLLLPLRLKSRGVSVPSLCLISLSKFSRTLFLFSSAFTSVLTCCCKICLERNTLSKLEFVLNWSQNNLKLSSFAWHGLQITRPPFFSRSRKNVVKN